MESDFVRGALRSTMDMAIQAQKAAQELVHNGDIEMDDAAGAFE